MIQSVGVTGTSLNLVGDGDEIDLICLLEESFDLKFADGELKDVETLGQLYDIILGRLPNAVLGPRMHCRSALAFRKIRLALRLMGRGEVRPSTPMKAVFGRRNHQHLLTNLECQAGLALGSREFAPWTLILGLLVSSLLVLWQFSVVEMTWTRTAESILTLLVVGPIGGIIIAAAAAALSNGWGVRHDSSLVTVGDLAIRAQHLNFARLGGRENVYRPQDAWQSLESLARMASGYDGPIDRDTRLIGP